MKNKGGSSAHDMIYNVLYSVMTDKVGDVYSYVGHKKKEVFSKLALCSCIYRK